MENSIENYLNLKNELKNFIFIENNKNLNNKEILIKLISRITNFYNYCFLIAHPQLPTFSKISNFMLKSSIHLAHIHFYLQWKIFRLRTKSYDSSNLLIIELLNQLDFYLKSNNNQIININEEEFFFYLQSDPKKVISLLSKDSKIVNIISNDNFIDNNINNQLDFLNHYLIYIRSNFNNKIINLIFDSNQEIFEQLIFSPNFLLKNDLDFLFKNNFENSIKFTQKIVEILQNFINHFNIIDPIDVSIISLMFFRSIFDYYFIINKNFFKNHIISTFRNICNKITLSTIGIPLIFFPNSNDSSLVIDCIRKDNDLNNISNKLTSISFLNSPLDILSIIYSVLTDIRYFTSKFSNDYSLTQSFDTIFGLFLIVLIGSELINIEEIFWFTINFSPIEGLTGPLDYAKATITASIIQCNKIVESFL